MLGAWHVRYRGMRVLARLFWRRFAASRCVCNRCEGLMHSADHVSFVSWASLAFAIPCMSHSKLSACAILNIVLIYLDFADRIRISGPPSVADLPHHHVLLRYALPLHAHWQSPHPFLPLARSRSASYLNAMLSPSRVPSNT